MQKTKFVWRVLLLLLKLGQLADEAKDLYEVYVDRGYGSGANAITDADLQVSIPGEGINLEGFTLDHFQEVAPVLAHLIAFMDGTPVGTVDREAIYNKYRRDI